MANIYLRYSDGSDSDDGSTWTAAKKTLKAALAAAQGGDTIFVSDNHAETITYSTSGYNSNDHISWACPNSTRENPVKVICVDDSAQPPTTKATTAYIYIYATGTTFARIMVWGHVYFYGIDFRGDAYTPITDLTYSVDWRFNSPDTLYASDTLDWKSSLDKRMVSMTFEKCSFTGPWNSAKCADIFGWGYRFGGSHGGPTVFIDCTFESKCSDNKVMAWTKTAGYAEFLHGFYGKNPSSPVWEDYFTTGWKGWGYNLFAGLDMYSYTGSKYFDAGANYCSYQIISCVNNPSIDIYYGDNFLRSGVNYKTNNEDFFFDASMCDLSLNPLDYNVIAVSNSIYLKQTYGGFSIKRHPDLTITNYSLKFFDTNTSHDRSTLIPTIATPWVAGYCTVNGPATVYFELTRYTSGSCLYDTQMNTHMQVEVMQHNLNGTKMLSLKTTRSIINTGWVVPPNKCTKYLVVTDNGTSTRWAGTDGTYCGYKLGIVVPDMTEGIFYARIINMSFGDSSVDSNFYLHPQAFISY